MIFTDHAKDRLNEYGINESDIDSVLRNYEAMFLDLKTGRNIAVKRWTVSKHLVVVFEKNDRVLIITLFPTSKIDKVRNRVEKERWLEL